MKRDYISIDSFISSSVHLSIYLFCIDTLNNNKNYRRHTYSVSTGTSRKENLHWRQWLAHTRCSVQFQ